MVPFGRYATGLELTLHLLSCPRAALLLVDTTRGVRFPEWSHLRKRRSGYTVWVEDP